MKAVLFDGVVGGMIPPAVARAGMVQARRPYRAWAIFAILAGAGGEEAIFIFLK